MENTINKNITIQDVENLFVNLTDEQKDLLSEVLAQCCWGSGDYYFINESGEEEYDYMMGYFTNVSKWAYTDFSGRRIAALFRSIYSKVCEGEKHRVGRIISHCSNWWGNGNGDMMFVRYEWSEAFEKWAMDRKGRK